ncbi:MAG TPA: PEP-CTERM sorting domain-containing protein, partial [Acetobacteraceae bacterium]
PRQHWPAFTPPRWPGIRPPLTIIIQTSGKNGSSVPGEYIQNTTPNANEELITNGFSASLNNGQQVGNVFNLALGGFIRFAVGGSTTPFTFNSFDLSGSGTIQIRGELNLNPVAGDLATINLTSTPTTYTFDWTGIDTVDFISGFTNINQMKMDNIRINDPVTAAPEPASLAILGVSLAGLGMIRRRAQSVV